MSAHQHGNHQSGSDGNHKNGGHHVVPLSVYYKVFFGLVALTIITVATSYIDFGGSMNIMIAMLIATTKAMLVVLFFMGLKYDGYENNVTFFGTFIFLVIFVMLSGFDWFFRSDLQAMKVDTSELVQSTEAVDFKPLVVSSADQLTSGNKLYAQNCATCHGAEGLGNGPAAGALNPKPRNFTATDGWKNGRTIALVFKTLTNGIPGSPMPAFAGLSVQDRMALTHFVRSLMKDAPADEAGVAEALQKQYGTPAKPKLPIDFTIDLMAQ